MPSIALPLRLPSNTRLTPALATGLLQDVEIFVEEHSSKHLEDGVGWAMETDPETLISTARAPYLLDDPAAGKVDPLVEAEELRSQLQSALTRTNRLIAMLKQQRRQTRAVQAAMASLRRLQQP